jgi:hypothetical protein
MFKNSYKDQNLGLEQNEELDPPKQQLEFSLNRDFLISVLVNLKLESFASLSFLSRLA